MNGVVRYLNTTIVRYLKTGDAMNFEGIRDIIVQLAILIYRESDLSSIEPQLEGNLVRRDRR